MNAQISGNTTTCQEPQNLALDKTILVIDDDEEVCAYIQKHLEDSGFQVVTTTSSKKGLALAKELQPYAITLDLLMPERDGWEVLNALKSDPDTARIPVIIVSVSDERDNGRCTRGLRLYSQAGEPGAFAGFAADGCTWKTQKNRAGGG